MAKHSIKTQAIILVLTLALASMLPAYSCGSSWPNGKVGVAVTIAPVADLVAQVGGDRVEVMVMVPPGRGPHDYEPTPNQMTQLSRADMYAKVGFGVEFELTWMDNLIEQNSDMIVAIGGGEISRDEVTFAGHHALEVLYFPAEMNREKALAKARQKGLAEPVEFLGPVHQLFAGPGE